MLPGEDVVDALADDDLRRGEHLAALQHVPTDHVALVIGQRHVQMAAVSRHRARQRDDLEALLEAYGLILVRRGGVGQAETYLRERWGSITVSGRVVKIVARERAPREINRSGVAHLLQRADARDDAPGLELLALGVRHEALLQVLSRREPERVNFHGAWRSVFSPGAQRRFGGKGRGRGRRESTGHRTPTLNLNPV